MNRRVNRVSTFGVIIAFALASAFRPAEAMPTVETGHSCCCADGEMNDASCCCAKPASAPIDQSSCSDSGCRCVCLIQPASSALLPETSICSIVMKVADYTAISIPACDFIRPAPPVPPPISVR